MANTKELGFFENRPPLAQERFQITPEVLLEDNRSSVAAERIQTWKNAKKNHRLKMILACSDSRIILPDPNTEIVVNYIAAGRMPPNPKHLLLENLMSEAAVVIGHFDGDTINSGQMPRGCGGLALKESHRRDGKGSRKIDNFVDLRVYDPDPILQAVRSAMHIAGKTKKPVLAVAQDHRNGKIYPIASFEHDEDLVKQIFIRGSVLSSLSEYNATELYEQGIPAIQLGQVPDNLQEFMALGAERMKSIRMAYPNNYVESEIQDPSLIFISTCLVPFQARFPITGDKPGRVFEVFAPRYKDDSGTLKFSLSDLQPSLEQAEFPIEQSINNHGQDGKSFASTNTILIDTDTMTLSQELASIFVNEHGEFIQNWLRLPGHKIFVSRTTDGILEEIEEFKT
ncbi:MAG: hypothetical protein AAB675_04750 [Patescibacteria group bacterium]